MIIIQSLPLAPNHRPEPERPEILSLLRHREIERCPSSWFAIRPDLAAMALDDPLYIRQTDTRARIFIVPNKSFKRTKELVRISHIKTDPVVANEEHAV